jgi:hypothetical protein
MARPYSYVVGIVALVAFGTLVLTLRTESVSQTTSPPNQVGSGTVAGSVLLGPTCPVEHIPPYPQCAPKPYQATVSAYRVGSTAVLQSTQSGTDGVFTFSIPPGSYTLQAGSASGGGSYFPRCASVPVSVTADETVRVTIHCDTGIR